MVNMRHLSTITSVVNELRGKARKLNTEGGWEAEGWTYELTIRNSLGQRIVIAHVDPSVADDRMDTQLTFPEDSVQDQVDPV